VYGLDAIAQNNGWAISVVGISIVFTGLVCLSIAINQIHKFLDLWENRKNFQLFSKDTSSQTDEESEALPIAFDMGRKEVARQFKLLAGTLNQPFSLARLMSLAEVSGLNRPHDNLYRLLQAKIIVLDDNGYFSWDMDRFNALIS